MAISPQTNIRLIKTPFEIDNKNQLTFISENAQKTYFLSLPYIEEENCTYQRKDNVIRFPALVDDILEYNYVMYQNEAYSNKWFYAFITKMTYLNNNCTEIAIETDVFQTWQFDIIYKQSFVEREHVNDDTIGLHTIDENLNVGDVIEEVEIEDEAYGNEIYWIGIETDWEIENNSTSGGNQHSGINVYNNIVSGSRLYLFKIIDETSFIDIVLFLLRTNGDKHIEDIHNLYIIPDIAINEAILTQITAYVASGGESFTFYKLPYSTSIKKVNTTIPKLYSFTNFTPKNR